MSGGAYNHAYRTVEDIANKIEADADRRRIAFVAHLRAVAQALKAIEWVDSGDDVRGGEWAAIDAVLDPSGNRTRAGRYRAWLEGIRRDLAGHQHVDCNRCVFCKIMRAVDEAIKSAP